MKQTIEGFLGEKVHGVLEWVYNESKYRVNDISLDELIQRYAESWKRDFNNEIKIVKSGLDEEHYFNKGIKFLIDYYAKHSPFRDNTIATEKKICINLDSERRYLLIGYIDRLVHHKENNIFEIHDYKTGSLKTQEELDRDRQLALYSIGIREIFNEASDVHLVWHFLDFNHTMISKRTKEQLEKLKEEIITLINKIESSKDFPPNPSKLCDWCEFRSYCPAMKDKN
jgi:putative RecB family exonuclease